MYDDNKTIKIRKYIFLNKINNSNFSIKKGRNTMKIAFAGVGKPLNSKFLTPILNLANLYDDAKVIKKAITGI